MDSNDIIKIMKGYTLATKENFRNTIISLVFKMSICLLNTFECTDNPASFILKTWFANCKLEDVQKIIKAFCYSSVGQDETISSAHLLSTEDSMERPNCFHFLLL